MRLVLFTPLILSVLVGCGGGGPPPVPVSGKVLLNSKPVDGALVTFHGKEGGKSASARTAADGTFKLTTNKTNDGAVPGDYVITIAKQDVKGSGSSGVDISTGNFGEAYGAQMGAAGRGKMASITKDLLPAKFGAPTTSGLTRTVAKGDANEFEFDLSSL